MNNIQSAKFAIIRSMLSRDNNLLNIKWLCGIAGVSRSGYYAWVSAEKQRQERDSRDKREFELVLAAYKHRGYDKGVRGIHMRLLHQNPSVVMNPKKIRRLMRKFNLYCPIRKANPYRRMAKALKTNNTAPNLLNRQFRAHGPRKVLLTDITYIPANDGKFCYLSVIMDAYTKQVLAHMIAPSLEVDFVLETVNLLIKNHGTSLRTETMIHSDQGCHYTSHKFIELVNDCSLRRSMSRKANCWDNAPQESFFGHMKEELRVGKEDFVTQIASNIDDWIDYYNNDRCQWSLSKLSPNEFYAYTLSGVYPLSGGSAPNPPGFIASISGKTKEDDT